MHIVLFLIAFIFNCLHASYQLFFLFLQRCSVSGDLPLCATQLLILLLDYIFRKELERFKRARILVMVQHPTIL